MAFSKRRSYLSFFFKIIFLEEEIGSFFFSSIVRKGNNRKLSVNLFHIYNSLYTSRHVYTMLILLLLFFNIFSIFPAVGWSFDHPEIWADTFPHCNSTQQSPVNILRKNTTRFNISQSLTYSFNSSQVKYVMFISESVLKLQIYGRVELIDDVFGTSFQTFQIHFYWKYRNITHGSAHYIDGKGFPLEMHIISKKSEYRDLTDAIHNADGLATMVFFFKIERSDNHMLSKIIDLLPKLGSNSILVEGFSLTELIARGSEKNYLFVYAGSMPVPPCLECVIWIVFNRPLSISRRQLEEIWKLSKRDGMFDTNIRPVQPLNGRIVFTNFSDAQEAHSSSTTASSYSVMYLTWEYLISFLSNLFSS